MNATAVAPDVVQYAALRDALAQADVVLALPELHGGICGTLSSGGQRATRRWLEECLADYAGQADVGALAQSLERLAQEARESLASDDLRFEPLLPDEDSLLEDQVQALALWCHGFLIGLAFGAARPQDLQDRALDEILEDFAQISRAAVTADDTQDPDQADFAFAELKEYVRVSVQIVFEELQVA